MYSVVENKAVEYTINFVKIPSPSGKEKELALYIRDLLEKAGFDRVLIDTVGNVIALIKGTVWDEPLVLEGHMDHVSPGDIRQWKYHPFSAKIVEGKIFGRGTVDMKAALASMIAASEHLLGKEFERTLALIFTVLEEPAEGVAFKIAVEETLRRRPYLVILGEASSLNIKLGHRGRALIEVNIVGRTAHASMPHLGLNPIIALSEIINYVENIELPKHEILGESTIAPTIIDCEPKCSPQIPDTCKVIFDRRTVLGEKKENVLEIFYTISRKLERKGFKVSAKVAAETLRSWTGRNIHVEYFFPSWLINKENTLALRSLNAIRNVVKDSGFSIWNFSTDGVYSAGEKNIVTLGFGPGSEKLAHQPNEWVSINDIRFATRGYIELIKEFALEH